MPPSEEIISNHADTAEVALALCNLGFDCRNPSKDDGSTQPPSSLSTMSLNKLADAACRYLSPNVDHAVSHQCPKLSFPVPPPPNFRPQLLRKVTPDYTRPTKAATAALTPSVPLIRNSSHLDISARRAKKNDVKHRRPKRSKGKDTSVSFAEMTRLMNTYGPIKCLRNRSNKNPDKEIKAASILRKFYRWFPDFEGE